MPLSPTETLRYSRHFPIISQTGQERLKNTAVLCLGAGGLGCPALQYLAAAGVGKLGIVDNDRVEISNLQRQILFTEADIGLLKADLVKQRLTAQNPHIEIVTYPLRLVRDNAEQLISRYDIVLDGSDNYQTRYLINDVCHMTHKPLVSASIFQFQGQIGVFNQVDGACYRCLYHSPPPVELMPDCATGGVLGVLPGIMGAIGAAEAIKLALGLGKSLQDRLLTVDVLGMQFKEYQVHPDPECPLCQHKQLSDELFDAAACNAAVIVPEVQPSQLAAWLQETAPPQLLDVREPYERAICDIGGEFMPLSHFDVSHLNLDKEQLTVVYCKHGVRSLTAARLLQAAGYRRVFSLQGGIIAWAEQVAPEIGVY
ncbi:MAG TPA: ThiF family adenylyltransferase [Gammaproteobacteria bacterium]|nr:ThiF family adenylyltransferase [Gammaproteobacteria bacterium]